MDVKRFPQKFTGLTCRVRSDMYPQAKLNDNVSVMAISSTDRVLVVAIS